MKSILLSLLIGSLTISCQREIRQSERGPQVPLDKIIDTQDRAISKLDPYTIKEGQRVHHVERQIVVSSQSPITNLSKEWTTDVTNVSDNQGLRQITTLKKVKDQSFGDDFVAEFKNVYTLELVDQLQLLDQLNQNRHSVAQITQKLKQKSEEDEQVNVIGVAFHNLRVERVSVVPPQLVQESPNCGDLTDCRIQADQILYDIIFKLSNDEEETHNIEWLISSEVPYFAGILKQCSSTVVTIETARVLVKQCSEVVDFTP